LVAPDPTTPSSPPAGAAPAPTKPAKAFDPNARSAVAAAAVTAAVGVNIANRVLSVARLTAATPLAWKQGKMPLWAAEMLLQKSTIDIVPYEGGKWNLWGKAYATSAALKGAGALLTLGMAVPNTVGALRNGGPAALVDTREGRTGVVTSLAGVATLGFLGTAASHGRAGGLAGMFHSAFHDPLLGKWAFVGPMIGVYALVLGNELGYLDSLNRGDKRSAVDVIRDANHNFGPNFLKLVTGGG
jgi:hypothetical protein